MKTKNASQPRQPSPLDSANWISESTSKGAIAPSQGASPSPDALPDPKRISGEKNQP